MDLISKPVTYTDMLQFQNQSITEIQEFTIVCGISVSLLKLMGIWKNSLLWCKTNLRSINDTYWGVSEDKNSVS